MREQARADARRMVVQPKGPRMFVLREPSKPKLRPPVTDIPDPIMPEGWWRA